MAPPQIPQHQCTLMLGMGSPAIGNGGSRQVPGLHGPGSMESPLQDCRTIQVNPKAHCTENQHLSVLQEQEVSDSSGPGSSTEQAETGRRLASPTSLRSAISLCTSLFGAVWAFTLASMTERDFFKLSAFLRAWEGDNQRCKLQVTFSFTSLSINNCGKHGWQAMKQTHP